MANQQDKNSSKDQKQKVIKQDKKQAIINKIDLHPIKLILSNGKEIEIITSWGKEGEVLKTDLDPFNHPAWQEAGKVSVNINSERINKFNQKFGNFGNI